VLIELEAPDVDTEMKTELLVDSGVWVLGEDRDELIFGLQRARLSEPHQWLGAWTFVWGSVWLEWVLYWVSKDESGGATMSVVPQTLDLGWYPHDHCFLKVVFCLSSSS
jgi:hypothetical protein